MKRYTSDIYIVSNRIIEPTNVKNIPKIITRLFLLFFFQYSDNISAPPAQVAIAAVLVNWTSIYTSSEKKLTNIIDKNIHIGKSFLLKTIYVTAHSEKKHIAI